MKLVTRKCIICEREFEVSLKKNAGNPTVSQKLRRGMNCITCSSKCSKIYYRIVKHLSKLYIKRREHEKV